VTPSSESYNNDIRIHIIEPLSRIVDRHLQQVLYYVLQGDFDAEAPNASGGCQGVRLIFDEVEAEFDWDFIGSFRGDGVHYHIAVRNHSIRQQNVRILTDKDTDGLDSIDATEASIWRNLIGKRLDRFEVLGYTAASNSMSPQAISLHFPNESIVIAVGMTPASLSTSLSIGDGDEVLIFSEREWQSLSPEIKGSLISLSPRDVHTW